MDTIFGAPIYTLPSHGIQKLPIESPNSGLPSLFPYASKQCMAADDARKEIPNRPSPHIHTHTYVWRKSTKSEKGAGKKGKRKRKKKKAEKRERCWVRGGGGGVGKKGKENFRLEKITLPSPASSSYSHYPSRCCSLPSSTRPAPLMKGKRR